MVGGNLLSHRVAPAVPSALWSLTSVFGMGTGGTSELSPPTKVTYSRKGSIGMGSRLFSAPDRPTGGSPDGRSGVRGGDQAERAISTGLLHALLRFHTQPINLVVFKGPSGRAHLEGGFPLRCFQRLSRPHVATRQCRWRDNRNTRGASIPVLSY